MKRRTGITIIPCFVQREQGSRPKGDGGTRYQGKPWPIDLMKPRIARGRLRNSMKKHCLILRPRAKAKAKNKQKYDWFLQHEKDKVARKGA